MADTKRQSLSGRIATPRVPTPSNTPGASSSVEQLINRIVGAHVRIQLSHPSRTQTGYVFALSPNSSLLTLTRTPLNFSTGAPSSAYVSIAIRSIVSLSILSLSPPSNKPIALPALDHGAALSRINSTMGKLQAAESRKGKGVTREAQALFDALHRTLPVTWDGTRIVVLGSVVISPPYTAGDCRMVNKKGNASELARVKKVVESERKRLGVSNGSSAPASGNVSGNVSANTSARATPELRKGG